MNSLGCVVGVTLFSHLGTVLIKRRYATCHYTEC